MEGRRKAPLLLHCFLEGYELAAGAESDRRAQRDGQKGEAQEGPSQADC